MIVRLLFVLALIPACSAEEYRFVSISGLYGQEVGEIILAEVYKRIGVDIKVSRMPGQRAVIEATSGRVDGEVMRIWSYGVEHPELIRVPTSYYFLESVAFYRKGSGIQVDTVEDLAKYSVLKVRGVKHANTITAGLTRVYDYDDSQEMFNALKADRDNVALTNRADGSFTIKKYNLQDIESSSHPLLSFPLYHYVHHKNKHLVEKIDREILAMKGSGELDQLIYAAEKQVYKSYGLSYEPLNK